MPPPQLLPLLLILLSTSMSRASLLFLAPQLPRLLSAGTTATRIRASSCPIMTATAAPVVGPRWVLDYDNVTADIPVAKPPVSTPEQPSVDADIAEAKERIAHLNAVSSPVAAAVPNAQNLTDEEFKDILPVLVDMYAAFWRAVVLLQNVGTYAGCKASVDGTDDYAKKLSSEIGVLFSQLSQAYESASLVLDLCPEQQFETFLESNEQTRASKYLLEHSRKLRRHRLSLAQENIMTKFKVTGHSAWGTMYTDLSSILSAVVDLDGKPTKMGLASAEALRDSPDESVRKASWEAIREAWLPHQETCAAALNAITGWRLDDYKQRGYDGYLTSSLHSNRMSNASLTALMDAIDANVALGRRALDLQARALKKKALNPWDLFAPAPVQSTGKVYTFDEGIELIANAVGEIDERAGEFVRMMRDKKWIEASRGDKKRPGAYQTSFSVSRTPRVYLSDYNGRAQLLLTLAHELGHAFHSWQMRDMPQQQVRLPMNLAETASIFFETVVGNKLLEKAESPEEKLSILWGEGESAASYLLNIPARFRFEEELNKKRAAGKLSVSEIDELMVNAWTRYYGDSLTDKERVGVFSQSKLHFYLTGISFYNWPYSFGYLFALGVYAEYENGNKDAFKDTYTNLLRDTGRMDAEDVVEKHLGGRIDQQEFWEKAIMVTKSKVNLLEQAITDLEQATT